MSNDATQIPNTTPATSSATAVTSDGDVLTTKGVKPGHKTTEGILSLLAILVGATLASGVIVNSTALQLAGIAQMTLASLGYTWSRTMVKTAAPLLLLCFGLAHMTACGGASSQEKALMATTATLNAAEVTFVAWDGKHQLDLVASCDPMAGKTACDLTLNAYRKERDKTVAAIAASYKAVDAAWTAVNDKTVATAVAAAVAVQQALAALGVK